MKQLYFYTIKWTLAACINLFLCNYILHATSSAPPVSLAYYFDGTHSTYIALPSPPAPSTAWSLTTDFTFESWFYCTTSNTPYLENQGGNAIFTLECGPSNGFKTTTSIVVYNDMLVTNNGTVRYYTWGLPTINTWHHIAVVRASGLIKVYIDGVSQGLSISDTNTYGTNSSNPAIGCLDLYSGARDPFHGYLSSMRLVNGVALYTANFTPPTSMLSTSGTSASSVTFTSDKVVLLTLQDVTLINNASTGSLTSYGGVSEVSLSPPTISSITPTYGSPTGGTSITISGTNLSGASITIGGVAATITSATSTSITATTPSGSGSQNVVVSTLGGSATLNNGFAYGSAPGAPTSLTVVQPSATTATVSFTAPNNTGGASVMISSYTVLATPVGAGNSVTISGATSPINLSGLSAGIPYNIYITATNSLGITGPSSSVVLQQPSSFTFSNLNQTYTGSVLNANVTVNAGSVSTSYSPSTHIGAGTYTVTASQTDSNYSVAGGVNYSLNGAYSFQGTLSSANYLQLTQPLVLGESDFTIETWFYNIDNGAHLPCIFSINGSGNWYDHHPGLVIFTNTASFDGSGGINYHPTLNTWHHLAIVRQGLIVTAYLDGQNVGQYDLTVNNTGNNYGHSFGGTSSYPVIGIQDTNTINNSYGFNYSGYLSNFRIAKQALYTSNFTPPTSDLGTTGNSAGGIPIITSNVQLLTLQNNNIDDATGHYTGYITNHGVTSSGPTIFSIIPNSVNTATLTINQATPVISWAKPSAITYGTNLSAALSTANLKAYLNSLSTVNGTLTGNFTINNGTSTVTANSVLPAGSYTLSEQFVPTGLSTVNFTTNNSVTVPLIVNKATETATISGGSSQYITYTGSGIPVSATATYGTLTTLYGGSTTVPVAAGNYPLTFTTNNIDYSVSTTGSLTINKATPIVTWATPSSIVYGTSLSSTQLNATSNISGNFTYSPASGILNVGTQTLNTTFTPTDTTNYTTNSSKYVLLNVTQAPSSFTFSNLNQTYTGTTLNATVTANAGGVAVSYNAVPIAAGSYTVTASQTNNNYSIAGRANYSSGTYSFNGANQYLSVASNPAFAFGSSNFTIELWCYPTSTSVYRPIICIGSSGGGKEIRIGQDIQNLGFGYIIPNNGNNGDIYKSIVQLPLNQWTHLALVRNGNTVTIYENGTAVGSTSSVSFNFLTASPVQIGYGFYPSDGYFSGMISNVRIVNGAAVYTSNFTPPYSDLIQVAGTSLLTLQGTNLVDNSSNNFAITNHNGVTSAGIVSILNYTPTNLFTATLTINKATPVITWATPDQITYGTALSGTQLNATATFSGSSLPGIFSYSPTSGTVLAAGTQTLNATFNPTDTTNFSSVSTYTTIKVNPAGSLLSLGNLSQTYNGSYESVTVNASRSGSIVTTYNGSTTVPKLAGTYSVVATLSGNYSGTATGTLTIAKATPNISWATPSAITYGTTLNNSQLNATGNFNGSAVAGSIVYSPASGTLLAAGTQTLTATLNPTDTTDLNSVTATRTLQVNQATPVITWSTSQTVNYGTVAAQVENASTSISGSLTYNVNPGTVYSPGVYSINATFTPLDTTNYSATTSTLALTVQKANPVLNVPTPVSIDYGSNYTLSSFVGTADVAGVFSLNPTGTTSSMPAAGTQLVQANFTPSDTTNYAQVSVTRNLTISTANASGTVITWNSPAPITYGTALDTTNQLNATANVPGTYIYSPDSGAILGVGLQTLNVTFTDNNNVSTTVYTTLEVNPAHPIITWSPAALTYPTALGSSQLNATTPVAGTFVYSPASGTVLSAGTQTLTATFTPTDTVNYNSVTTTANVTVNPQSAIITLSNLTDNYSGYLNQPTVTTSPSNLPVTVTYNGSTAPPTAAGIYNVNVVSTDPNFSGSATGTLVVAQLTPTVTWANPADITYGTSLDGTQLNAISNVPGTFSFSPGSGVILGVGSQTLNTTFTPTDTTNYASVSSSVQLQVNQASPIVTWANPSDVPWGTTLNSLQLDATANVPGTYVYSPATGSILVNHSQTLNVTFNPSDTANYTSNSSVYTTINTSLPTPVLVFSNPNPSALNIGDTLLNPVSTSLVGGTYGSIIYTSSNPAVALVTSAGLIVAVSPGTAVITATQAGVYGINWQATQTCAVTVNSSTVQSIYAFGDNRSGQYGDGTTTSSNIPKTINYPNGTNFVSFSEGNNYSLGLSSDGRVYAWGDNTNGQLGDGTNVSELTPIQVTGLSGHRIIQVSCAGDSSMALCDDGSVYTWGNNQFGVLGISSPNASSATPSRVASLSNITAIDAGYFHELALSSSGVVYAWGFNAYGQLGDGTNSNRSTPVVVSGLSGKTIKAIAAGNWHNLALCTDGTLYGWGYNSDGQVGNGTSGNVIYSAVPVVGLPAKTITAIAAGGNFSAALMSDGTVYDWGYNANGQLGDGATISNVSPHLVTGLVGKTVTAISAGGYGMVVLCSDGSVYTWGYNGSGQLGIGQNSIQLTTPQLTSITDGTAIYAHSTSLMEFVAVSQNKLVSPIISWSAPSSINYGSNLSSILNAIPQISSNSSYPVDGILTYYNSGTIITANDVLDAGSYTLTETFVPTGNFSAYFTSNNSVTLQLTVTKATEVATINGGNSQTFTYSGNPVSISATAGYGTLTTLYGGSTTVPTAAGVYPLSFTTSNADYLVSTTGTLTINQARPIINWSTPNSISYGTGLSNTQLSANASISGNINYSPTLGAVLPVGTQTLTSTFTPTDTNNYTSVTNSVQIVVSKATPVVTWATPNAVVWGTQLSATQLNATSSVNGTFNYNPPLGTALTGTQTLNVSFTPSDTANYTTNNSTYVTQNVTGSAPVTNVPKVAAGIVVSNTTQTYTGQPLPVSVSLTPSNLNAAVVYYPGFSVPTEAGTYYVLVNVVDSTYYGSQSAVLTILPATQTLSISQPVSLAVGTPVKLTATASSNGPVSFSLVSGNANLSGSTLTALDSNPIVVQATQAGSNDYKSASATITLKATAGSTSGGNMPPPVTVVAPSITTQPASQSVTAGVSTTLSVVASGTSPTYQWYFNNVVISGATNSSYTLVSPNVSNAGSYTVVVTNSAGVVTSNVATLAVNLAPSIATQPASISVVSGQSATFTVSATGTAPLTYQWLKNGVVIPNATSASLTLNTVSSTDAASYTVVLTNVVGSVTSSKATLTVTPVVSSPTITSQPTSLTIVQGSLASFTVVANGTGNLSYQWYVNGNVIGGATSATYTINTTSAFDAGSYTVTVTNQVGSISSATAQLTFNGLAPKLSIVATSNLNVNVGQTATFSAVATGTGTLNYQWYLNGQIISGATSSTYTIPAVALSDSGNYTVSVTNNYGSATSNQLTLAVNQLPAAPVFSAQLVNQAVVVGGSLTLSANVTGVGPITYQWYLNGQPIAGATSSTYTVSRVTSANAGTYVVIATNAGGSSTSTSVLTVIAQDHLVNLSARSVVGSSNLTVGFVSSGSAAKSLLLRGVGPGLSTYGVSGVLANPLLTLYSSAGTSLASNNAWGGSSSLSSAFTQVGAFPFAAASNDTALLQSLNTGSYTAIVSGANSSTGAAMIEIYDADPTGASSRLVNISARGMVGTGSSIMTSGFVITGATTETLLIRAVGPTLASYGVSGVLAQPTLTVYNAAGVSVASNTIWGGGSALSSAMTQVGAFTLPTTSADSAVLVTLPAGAYTVQVSGVNGATGNALVEIYEVSSP